MQFTPTVRWMPTLFQLGLGCILPPKQHLFSGMTKCSHPNGSEEDSVRDIWGYAGRYISF